MSADLDLPQDVMSKLAKISLPFVTADSEVERILAQAAASLAVTRRVASRAAHELFYAVERARLACDIEAKAMIRLAYVRGARQGLPDFRLETEDETYLGQLESKLQAQLYDSHGPLSQRLDNALRRPGLKSVAMAGRSTPATPALLATLEAPGRPPRDLWSLQQYAQAVVAGMGQHAFSDGVLRGQGRMPYGM